MSTLDALWEPVRIGSVTTATRIVVPARQLPAETVIRSMLRIADDSLATELAASGVPLTKLGECLAPREVDDATQEGVLLGRATGGERATTA